MAVSKLTFTTLAVERNGTQEAKLLPPIGLVLQFVCLHSGLCLALADDNQCNYSNYPKRTQCKVCDAPQTGMFE